MERTIVYLNPDYLATRRTGHYLSYAPDKIKQDGVQISGSLPGINATHLLTYQETLVLVKALREIPEVEQATIPETARQEPSGEVCA